jgi:hypothetical protein
MPVTRWQSIINTPSMVRVEVGIKYRLRANPTVRIPRCTMRARLNEISILVDIGFWRLVSRYRYLKQMGD